jgi:hypothetical protein
MSNDLKTSEQSPSEDGLEWPDLYRQAFARFGSRALWNMRELDQPTPRDALAAARQLRVEGDLKARRLAELIERSAGAYL